MSGNGKRPEMPETCCRIFHFCVKSGMYIHISICQRSEEDQTETEGAEE